MPKHGSDSMLFKMMLKLCFAYFLITLPFLSAAFISPAASTALHSWRDVKSKLPQLLSGSKALESKQTPVSLIARLSGGAYIDRNYAANAYSGFDTEVVVEDIVDNPHSSAPWHFSLPSFIPDPLKQLHLSFLEGNQTRVRGSETISDFVLHAALTGVTIKTLMDNNALAVPSVLMPFLFVITSKLFPIGETSYMLSERTSWGTTLKFIMTCFTSALAGILPGLAMYLPSLAFTGGGSSYTAVPPFTDVTSPLIKPWYLILYLHTFQLNLLFDKQKESLFLAIPLLYYLADAQRWSWLPYFNDPLVMGVTALAANYFMTIPRKVHPDQYLGGMVEAPRKYVPPNHDLTVLNGLMYFGLQLTLYKGLEYLLTYVQTMWNA